MIGATIEHYEILDQLGKGGMGVVYKARDTKLDRIVALKFLLSEFSRDERATRRFMQEARAASALDHANIATVFDIRETSDGNIFIVMGYYEGGSLGDRMGDTQVTQTVSTVGTPVYMAPEQLTGEDPDVRVDVWAFGVLLYKMLIGRRPFAGAYAQALMYAILNTDPEPVQNLRPDSPDDLVRIVNRCLAKKPEQRFASAKEIYDQLKGTTGTLSAAPVADAPASDRESSGRRSVAVFDFQNLSKKEEMEWIASGIAETMTIDLKKLGAISVVSREKVLSQVKNNVEKVDPIACGRALGVDWIVWGAFQSMGQMLRVTAHVTDVSSGTIKESTRADGKLEDIFSLQDKIVSELARVMDVELSETARGRVAQPETDKLDAYELYVKGRLLFHRFERESFAQALVLFERAIDLDPAYALAYSGLGSIYTFRYIATTDRDDLAKAREYLDRAVSLDPHLSEPYVWLSYINARQGDADGSVTAAGRATELDPDNYSGHYFAGVAYAMKAGQSESAEFLRKAQKALRESLRLELDQGGRRMVTGVIYIVLGRHDLAENILRAAEKLEFSNLTATYKHVGTWSLQAHSMMRSGEMEQAELLLQKSLENLKTSDHVYAASVTVWTHALLGNLFIQNSRIDEAISALRTALSLIEKDPGMTGAGHLAVRVTFQLAVATRVVGLKKEGGVLLKRALEMLEDPGERDFFWAWDVFSIELLYEAAAAHAAFKKADAAFEFLNRAVNAGWSDHSYLSRDVRFEALRRDERLGDLARKMANMDLVPAPY
ncbi:MAG: hypothetical protein BMS9Abin05_1436 [Rhodothermia bacterium]|nr:MAG: hypothetical protein BMS9Abin05_1436 [Rhodothermia bacterium]